MKKAIIFGANGQDGYYLNQLLLKEQVTVTGVSRGGNFLKTDISKYTEVCDLIKKIQPDYIFHLAANSTTSHDAVFENHETICTGTLNILEAVKNFSPRSTVFISGSGLQFKNIGQPIKETDEFLAEDPYSASRISSCYYARYYRSLGLKIYIGYFFNHDSPRRNQNYVAKKITEAVKRMAAGSEEILQVRDATVIKEWAFAGDIVRAIWLFVNNDHIYEANISNGEGFSIRHWIIRCFDIANLAAERRLVPHPEIYTNRILVSDNSRIRSLGYQPEVCFGDLAKMMMEHE